MTNVLSHISSQDHYQADACVVWCFDDRFSALLGEVIALQRLGHVDKVIVAGGAKGIASPSNFEERDYLIDQIKKSILLHKTPRVILMVHAQCGAYGKAFSHSDDERAFYFDQLKCAKDVIHEALKQEYPHIVVDAYFAHFSGIESL